ncbi:hypothetical protein FGO68_gene13520 [Halteria grandinella]|uniref:Uncharacterized protein n=1 Tax=Halteria grandinella TaxID=5974 RepID=A0A8J8NRK6_HALGN|nr:hypothetical protein FGO68_gene13520 [Halteria grandinella]
MERWNICFSDRSPTEYLLQCLTIVLQELSSKEYFLFLWHWLECVLSFNLLLDLFKCEVKCQLQLYILDLLLGHLEEDRHLVCVKFGLEIGRGAFGFPQV